MRYNGPKRVVVTGGGVVSALGIEWPEILAKLKAGRNCVKVMDEWDVYGGMTTRLAAPIDFTAPPFPRKKIRGMGRIALFALTATEKALAMAGLQDSPELRGGRCGISYGSSMGSVDPVMDIFGMLVDHDMKKMSATTYIRAMPHTCAANLEVFYGLTGRLISSNTACTSGSLSIGYAYEAIQCGLQDMMIAGGAEELSPVDSAIFDTLFTASARNGEPHKVPAAFDKNRDGLVIGEGAGTLILEEYEHALRRGATIYGELVGFGTNTDGTHITQPNRETQRLALKSALEDAGIGPGDIGYVSVHGTATDTGDTVESWATYDVFQRAVPVSSLKNYIGHTLGACGAIEAWLSLCMMREGWFCPNINLDNPDPALAPLDYIPMPGVNIKTNYIMSNNFAFGGVNTSLIFKNIEENRP